MKKLLLSSLVLCLLTCCYSYRKYVYKVHQDNGVTHIFIQHEGYTMSFTGTDIPPQVSFNQTIDQVKGFETMDIKVGDISIRLHDHILNIKTKDGTWKRDLREAKKKSFDFDLDTMTFEK